MDWRMGCSVGEEGLFQLSNLYFYFLTASSSFFLIKHTLTMIFQIKIEVLLKLVCYFFQACDFGHPWAD